MGCLIKKLIFLVLLAGALVIAFLNRDRIRAVWQELRGSVTVEEQASPELADEASAKLTELRRGRRTNVALGEAELQSLLLYKYPQLLPAFVDSPRIRLEDGKIEVKGRIPVERLPQLNELGEAAAFLPDTTEVAVVGQLLPLSSGRVALAVDQVRAARIPLPKRLVSSALRKLGRKDEPGLPADALAVPLPPGVDAAYVRGDSIVFLNNASAKK